jgi:hypothetical protein
LYFWSNTNGLLKNCSLLGTVSLKNNDIARNDTTANVTFACADGEVGTPVQMSGTEITKIPALTCTAPKYACDYKTLKCKKDPHGGSSSMADCSKTCCDAPLNCGMYNNTEICGHKYTVCDVCDTCCHVWLKPQSICDGCVADECTSGRHPDCCVSFECVNSKCQRAFRATGKYPSIDACKVACG